MIVKRLSKKEMQRFTNKYEIKCSKAVVELADGCYFITINNDRPFSIEYDLIKDFI